MIDGKYDDLLVDDVEGMPKFSGVSNTGDAIEAGSMFLEKRDQLGSRPITEAENDTMIEIARSRISGDAPEERRARSFRAIDCRDVALFHIRPDAVLGRGQMHQVPLH